MPGDKNSNAIRPSSRIDEARWIAERLAPFGSCVAAIVPAGFEAYVRIFHPVENRATNQFIRWSEVAAMSGRTMHRLAQFDAINLAAISSVDPATYGPMNGNLHPQLLKALCETLSQNTSTPEACNFCLWEGWGPHATEAPSGASDSLPEFIRKARTSEWRVHLPARDYLFFEGPIGSATEFGSHLTADFFLPQSPNLFWPQDRAWCVASEIDLNCTLVGGSDALAQSLIGDPELEAWRVFPEDPIAFDSDTINR